MKKEIDYAIFKYLWILAILPKTIQMMMFLLIALIIFYKKRKNIYISNVISNTFIITNIIYLFSVVIAVLVEEHEISRILAAFNSCLSIFIGIYLFQHYLNQELYINKISKYMFNNMLILFFLYITFLLLGTKGNLSFLNGPLCGYDDIGTGSNVRFIGYLEYSNLVTYMYLMCYPFAIYYLRNNKKRLVLFEVLSLLPIYASHSRTGSLCATMIAIISFFSINMKDIGAFFSKNLISISLLFGMLFLALFFAFRENIIEYIYMIFAKRQGSTNTRFLLYNISFSKMIKSSPIWGCGVRDMFFDIPYGSHSTFIGMFYKTGLLGGSIFLLGSLFSIISLVKRVSSRYELMLNLCIIMIYFVSIFEDIDGVNWSVILFLVVCSLTFNSKMQYKFSEAEKR